MMRFVAPIASCFVVTLCAIGCSSEDTRIAKLRDETDSAKVEAQKARGELEQARADAEKARAEAAIESARISTNLLRGIRTLYALDVAERVARKGILVTHDYQSREGAIPLPETLIMELGRRVGEGKGGIQIRLYSDWPFPSRKDGGPRDDFERAALTFLREHPDEAFSRFEDFKGRRSLRYGTADRMQASCVQCHNLHPESPNRNWKVGDVGGVLEVVIPSEPPP